MARTAYALLVCGFASSLASLASAGPPAIRYDLTGDSSFDYVGRAVTSVGDIDGDGLPDFAAGAPELRADGRGRILVISGSDGGVLKTFRSESSIGFGSDLARAGDFDGDAVQDLLTFHGALEVRSGKSGDVLFVADQLEHIVAAATGVDDLDGDGARDIAGCYSGGIAFAFSGRSRALLWERELTSDGFGTTTLADLGDVDGDGWPDLAVGVPVLSGARQGTIFVIRGKDGASIYQTSSGRSGDSFGSALAALSDLDGDGVRDLVVGSNLYQETDRKALGRIEVLSGHDGHVLWSRTGHRFERNVDQRFFRGERLGASVGRAGDADGDGVDDVLAWAPREITGGGGESVDESRVYLCSGRDGALLAAYEPEEAGSRFGRALESLGDVNGDGRSELIFAADQWSGSSTNGARALTFAGKLYVMSYAAEGAAFIRGDANLDHRVDMSDAVTLAAGLLGSGVTSCAESWDVDRNGALNLTDAVGILLYLFNSEAFAPDLPFPDCGRLETFQSRLPCERSACP